MQIICNFAHAKDKLTPLQHRIMVAEYYLIKIERFNQGLTQSQLAKKAQISLRTLQNAEHGKSITPAVNRAIRDALGLK